MQVPIYLPRHLVNVAVTVLCDSLQWPIYFCNGFHLQRSSLASRKHCLPVIPGAKYVGDKKSWSVDGIPNRSKFLRTAFTSRNFGIRPRESLPVREGKFIVVVK